MKLNPFFPWQSLLPSRLSYKQGPGSLSASAESNFEAAEILILSDQEILETLMMSIEEVEKMMWDPNLLFGQALGAAEFFQSDKGVELAENLLGIRFSKKEKTQFKRNSKRFERIIKREWRKYVRQQNKPEQQNKKIREKYKQPSPAEKKKIERNMGRTLGKMTTGKMPDIYVGLHDNEKVMSDLRANAKKYEQESDDVFANLEEGMDPETEVPLSKKEQRREKIRQRIREKGDMNVKILLDGEWVWATVENRLEKAERRWAAQDEFNEHWTWKSGYGGHPQSPFSGGRRSNVRGTADGLDQFMAEEAGEDWVEEEWEESDGLEDDFIGADKANAQPTQADAVDDQIAQEAQEALEEMFDQQFEPEPNSEQPTPKPAPKKPETLGTLSPEMQRAVEAKEKWTSFNQLNEAQMKYTLGIIDQVMTQYKSDWKNPDIASSFIQLYSKAPKAGTNDLRNPNVVSSLKGLNAQEAATGLILFAQELQGTTISIPEIHNAIEGIENRTASLVSPLNQLKNKLVLDLGEIYERKKQSGEKYKEQQEKEKVLVEKAEANWKEIQPRFSELIESPEKAAEVYQLIFEFANDFNPYNKKARDFRVQYKYFAQYAPELYLGGVKRNGNDLVEIICGLFGMDPEALDKKQKVAIRKGYQVYLSQKQGVEINPDGHLGAQTAMPIVGDAKSLLGPIPFGNRVELRGNRSDERSLKGVNFSKVNKNREIADNYAEKQYAKQAKKINDYWLKAKASGDEKAMRICKNNLAQFGYLPGESGPEPDPTFQERIQKAEEERKNDG